MVKLHLWVSDKAEKFDARVESQVRSKLSGKKFKIELTDSDLDTADNIVNPTKLEPLILDELTSACTLLKLSDKLRLDKLAGAKKLGDVTLDIELPTSEIFRCTIALTPPAKSDPTKRKGYKPPKGEKPGKSGEKEGSEDEGEEDGKPAAKQKKQQFNKRYLALLSKHPAVPTDPNLIKALKLLDNNTDGEKTKELVEAALEAVKVTEAKINKFAKRESDANRQEQFKLFMPQFSKLNAMIGKLANMATKKLKVGKMAKVKEEEVEGSEKEGEEDEKGAKAAKKEAGGKDEAATKTKTTKQPKTKFRARYTALLAKYPAAPFRKETADALKKIDDNKDGSQTAELTEAAGKAIENELKAIEKQKKSEDELRAKAIDLFSKELSTFPKIFARLIKAVK